MVGSRMTDRNRGCDILFSQVIRQRGTCERCGEPGEECAHIIRRHFLRTRWNPDNAWCLCKDCHYTVDNHQIEFALLVERTIGTARYDELRELARPTSGPKPDREQIRADLRRLLKGAAA